ncbi:ABC transporter permease [Thermogladius sp. 4427co]|uniref:ABC transporter permease n=1 Tax=Thermogladius sp. 4427co TaxID=3450718 RepID=UPI003F7A97E7
MVEAEKVKKYIINRILASFLVFVSVLIINFILINIAPGNPALMMGAETGLVSNDYAEYLIHKWGLDQPLYERLLIYMYNVFRGDLGISYRYAVPVVDLIVERIPMTLLIMVPSIVLAFMLGVLIAVLAASKPGGALDVSFTGFSMLTYSMPSFWLGIILIEVFSIKLKILPATGIISPQYIGSEGTLGYYLDMAKHAVLPILTLTLGLFPIYFRLTKSVIMDQLAEDYIIVLKAKGLSKFRILYFHALRNAIIPAVTLLGLQLGFAFAGAAIIENVFAWPGIGRLMLDAITARDYPLIMGIFLLVTVMVLVANIIVDLIYGLLDPRVKTG